jgi:hypothetical protein
MVVPGNFSQFGRSVVTTTVISVGSRQEGTHAITVQTATAVPE